MNILYCGDGNIADGVLLSVLSLLPYVRQPLHIYLLTARVHLGERELQPLTGDFVEDLQAYLRQQDSRHTVELFDITELFEQERPEANMATRFTPCCMLRLYADQVPQLPDRLLYLDNDVLCRGDILPLYSRNMEGKEIAGVLDHYGSWFFRRVPWKRDYLNSGVLLLNLAQIRSSGLFARCRRLCREKKMFMPDQSAVNKLAACKDILPRCWNEQKKLRRDTVLRHFTTTFRFFPWFHTVSVKPWNITGMHDTLKLHEFDPLLSQYQKIKEEMRYAKTK